MSLENEIVVSPAPGTYVLVLRCSSNRTIRVGCLGSIRLRPGYYLYVGSGFGPGGLRARNRAIAADRARALPYPGTNYAIASLLPDYSLVGNPAAPVHPGDIVVLWGTGFGATNPVVPAGVAASGTPFTVAVPTVTVGGIKAQVLSSLLTPGSAGLYQVTIQVPVSAPSGALEVRASSGVVTSPAGVSIIVKTP